MFKPLYLSLLCLSLAVACQTAPPSDLIPYPQVIPTPPGSYSSYRDKTDAEVQARKTSFAINYSRMNPEQTRVLYTYEEQRKVTFGDYTFAYQDKASGLWLYDRQQQKHINLFPAPEGYNDNRFHTVAWLNNTEIVYLNHERNQLFTLNVETKESKRVFDTASNISFKVQDGYIFILSHQDQKVSMTRIDGRSGERRVKAIPHTEFYNDGQDFDVLTPDLVLLGQFKEFYKANDYPFKVSNTSPPPIRDSFLFDLSSDQITPIEEGLDLNTYEKIEMSSDQRYFATTRGESTQIYDRSGKLLLEKAGTFYWLAADQLLLQAEREISRVTLTNNQPQVSEGFSTQTACTKIQGTQPTVMECLIDNRYENESLSRVFSVYPTQELQPAKKEEAAEAVNARLAPAEKNQPVRVWEEVFSPKGFARLSTLNPSGELQTVFELAFPEKSTFTFDPNDSYWYQRY